MRRKELLAVLAVLTLPVLSLLLVSGCGNNTPTSGSSSSGSDTFVNAQGTPCDLGYGHYDQAGIGLTPLPQDEYVAIHFDSSSNTICGYASYSGAGGEAGIYAANSGSGPETFELRAYGNSSSHGGALYGSSPVSVSVPVGGGAWQMVSMPPLGYTDCGPDIFLFAHAIGADLSIGAKGTGHHESLEGNLSGGLSSNPPTPTITATPGANYEMYMKYCP